MEHRCYGCGQAIAAEPAAWAICPRCGTAVHLATARAIAAIDRVARTADAEAGLDDACRADLRGVLAAHRRAALQFANELQPTLPERAPAPPAPEHAPPAPEGAPPAAVPEPQLAPTAAAEVVAAMAAAPARAGPDLQGPSLWSRLGPLFTENLLFALAAFLLVAGAVYFTTTAWTTMSGSTQKLVVAGALLGFAGLVHGAGVALARAHGLLPAARVLSMVAAALVPAATAVTGLMYREHAALAMAASAVATAVGHLLLRTALRRQAGPVHRMAPSCYDALVFVGVFAHAITDWRLLGSLAAAATVLGVAGLQRAAERDHLVESGDDAAEVAFPSRALWLATALAALAFSANLALAANVTLAGGAAPLGVLVAAAGLAWVVLESAANRPGPARSVAAVAAAIVGTAMASGDTRCLMVAAWCAALTAGQSSLRLDQARLLVPALLLSAIGYLFLPAPVRELAMQLRAGVAGQLGYAPERLPLSFYGITFLPYLGLLALLAWWFRRSGRVGHRRVTGVTAISVAGGLAGMSLLLGSDLRAPMAVLPADGLLLIALGWLGHSRSAVFAGCLGLLGGLACALVWFEVPAGISSVAVSAACVALLRLARRNEAAGFAARVVDGFVAAALVGVAALALWLVGQALPPERATPWSLLHAAALVPAVLLWRRLASASWASTLLLAPLPALWATATGVAAVLAAVGFAGQRQALPFALALVTGGVAGLLPRIVRVAAPRQPMLVVAGGMVAMQWFLLPGLLDGWREQPFAWSAISGLAALAAATALLAHRAQVPALLAVAVLEAVVPMHLVAGAWLGSAAGPPGFVGPAVLALVAGLFDARRAAVGFTCAGLAVVLAIAMLGWRFSVIPAAVTPQDAWAGLMVGLLVAAHGLRAWRRQAPGVAWRPYSLVAGALAALLLPLLLLDVLVTELPHYAIGFLVVGLLAFAASRFVAGAALALAGGGLFYAALGVLVTFAWSPTARADHGLRLGLFAAAAAVAAVCRPRALRTASTLVAMVALAGAVVLQPVELRWIAERWWPVPMLGWCTASLAAVALPRWRSRAPAVLGVAALPVLGTALAIGGWAIFTAARQPERDAADGALADAIALGFLAAASALSLHWRKWGAHLRWTATALAAWITAPANGLLHGQRATWFRPDLELALLALAVAIRVRGQAAAWAMTLGLAAALLTGFEVQDVSTPATVTVLASVPLALLLRRKGVGLAWWHGLLLVAAAWSWIAFALAGGSAADLGPWLALAAAVVASALPSWLAVFGGAAQEQLLAARASAWLLALGAVVLGCVGALPRTAVEVAASLAACAVVALGSGRAARAQGMAPLVHLALAAVIAAYAALATGTELLAPLAGRHHHALTVLGATLFLAAGQRTSPLQKQWFGAAVALPFVAVLAAPALGGLTFALLAGAAALGFGAVLGRAPWLGALALVLGNAGLFHLWIDEGVFDPSFYGVPAGLSLLFAAQMAAGALGPVRVTVLRVAGLSVLYGSVLVQVARVAAPLHALLLFAVAMAGLAWGALRRQVAVLVAGVATVVLDVVAYLAQRGFEQDFVGSLLLVGAGGTVFAVAARTARRRARAATPAPGSQLIR